MPSKQDLHSSYGFITSSQAQIDRLSLENQDLKARREEDQEELRFWRKQGEYEVNPDTTNQTGYESEEEADDLTRARAVINSQANKLAARERAVETLRSSKDEGITLLKDTEIEEMRKAKDIEIEELRKAKDAEIEHLMAMLALQQPTQSNAATPPSHASTDTISMSRACISNSARSHGRRQRLPVNNALAKISNEERAASMVEEQVATK